MGLINKLKNMFTEEVEVEDVKPIKKDVIQVEIPAPTREAKRENLHELKKELDTEEKISDSNLNPKKEEKFVFPVFFDDDDFESIDEKKKEQSVPIKTVADSYKKEGKKVEPKVFKPTPIISPIYGILDKNYHKEDITSRSDTNNSNYEKLDEFSIDSIRKKAYGTLEDDLENNMFMNNDKFFEEKKEVTADMFDDMDSDTITKKYKKEETVEVTKKVPSRLERNKDIEEEIDNNMIEEEMNKNFETEETTNESDLLNLIDLLYDKGDNE